MKNYLIPFTLLLALSSCVSSQAPAPTQLNDKVAAQAPADSPEQIMERAAAAFSNAPGLSPEQKLKLNAIYVRVYRQSMQIRRELGQSKSLLFMTLAKVDYKNSEITNLKKKIVGLDQQRMTLMFSALDDVQRVIGKGIEAEKIYRHFQDYEIPHTHVKDVL